MKFCVIQDKNHNDQVVYLGREYEESFDGTYGGSDSYFDRTWQTLNKYLNVDYYCSLIIFEDKEKAAKYIVEKFSRRSIENIKIVNLLEL